jgi:hypothetical protein
MDILWEAAGLAPPYICGKEPDGPDSRQPVAFASSPSRPPPDFPDDWRPMGWLPRLKIFRTPLDRLPPELDLPRLPAEADAG